MSKCYTLLLLFILSVFYLDAQSTQSIYPKEGQLVSEKVEFSWNLLSEAKQYELKIFHDKMMLLPYAVYSTNCTKQTVKLAEGTYFWKVIGMKGSSTIDSSSIREVHVFNPLSIDSLSVWMIADSGVSIQNGAVRKWCSVNDSSIYGSQTILNKQSTLISNALNKYSALNFDDKSNQLITNIKLSNSSFLLPIVYSVHEKSTRGIRLISGPNDWFIGPYAGKYLGFNGSFLSGKDVMKDMFALQSIFVVNGTTQNFINDSLYGQNIAAYTPGVLSSMGNRANSSIAELIILKGKVTDSVRQSIDHYLMDKYAPPVNLGADKVVCSFPDSIVLDIDYALDYQWSTGDTTNRAQIDSAGKYYVSITDIFGRRSKDSIYVLLDTIDHKINFAYRDTSICLGDTIKLETDYYDRYAYRWNTSDSTSSIEVGTAGQYVLSVQNCLNNTYSDTINVSVNQPKFSLGADTLICFNEQLQLQADSIFLNATYLWSNQKNTPSILVDTAQVYHLTVTDQLGCFYSDSISVQIDSSLYDLTLGSDTSLCTGNLIGLNYNPDTIQSYLWNTSDTTALIEITASGNYQLRVSNGRCKFTDSVQIGIQGQAPQASFTATNFCFKDSVNFNDLSQAAIGDNIVAWRWSFQNQDSAFVSNPSHKFAAVQDYMVVLQVETDKGCSDTSQQLIRIQPKPQADFESTLFCSKQNVYFKDSSKISSGSIIGYLWDFGDTAAAVNSSNQQFPDHKYDTSGTYQVSLVVSSNFGCKDTIVKPKRIRATPIVDFSFDGNCYGDSTQLINESILGLGSIKEIRWYTNNQTINKVNPKVLYNTVGSKTVYLIVTSDSSCSESITKDIEIYPTPKADFIIKDFCEKDDIKLFDGSKGDHSILNWRYVLDGKDTSYSKNAHFNNVVAGIYPVNLMVVDTNACKDSIEKLIKVSASPKAAFQILNNGSGVPYTLRVENQSKSAESFVWDFGNNGDTAHAKQPHYKYYNSGDYALSLIAISAENCRDTIVQNLRLLPYYLDAMLKKVVLQEQLRGDLGIQLQIVNAGNNVIEKLKVATNVNNGTAFVEELEGPIYKTQAKGYQLNSGILLDGKIDFICVKIISVNDTVDAILDNNKICEAVEHKKELYVNFYPNPTMGNIKMEYVLPYSGDFTLRIYDQMGRAVYHKEMSNQEKGYYFSLLKIEHLKSGIYHYSFQYKDQKKSGTFIKQ